MSTIMQRMLSASAWIRPWSPLRMTDTYHDKPPALEGTKQQYLGELLALQQALACLQERCDAQSAELREQRHYSKVLEKRCEQLELSCEAQQRMHARSELLNKHQALSSKGSAPCSTDLDADMDLGHLHMEFLAELAAKDAELQIMDAQLQHACQVALACQQQLAVYEHWYSTVRQYSSPDMRAEDTLGALEQLLQGNMEERDQVPSVGFELGRKRRAAKSCSQPGGVSEEKVQASQPMRSSCGDLGRNLTRAPAANSRCEGVAQWREADMHRNEQQGCCVQRSSVPGKTQHADGNATQPVPRSRLSLLPQELNRPAPSLRAHPSPALVHSGKAQGPAGAGCTRPGRIMRPVRSLPSPGLDSPFCPDSPCAVINSRGSSCGGNSNAISEWEGVEAEAVRISSQQ